MPQQRTVLYREPAFEVAQVRSHHARLPQWGEPQTIASARIVFPSGSTLLEVGCGDSGWIADGLTAIRFGEAVAYRLRCGTRSERHSMVVTGERAVQAAGAAREPAFFLLPPSVLYRVQLARRAWGAGEEGAAMLASLLAELRPSRRQAPARGAAARARRLLAQGADAPSRASLRDLADAVSCSPFHLARSFRAQTGLSLQQYGRQLRMVAAMERLAAGERDLAGLAHDLGYCSQSHLGAVFRREVGATLGEARRRLGSARI